MEQAPEQRRARVRALVLAAAKARAQQALTLADAPQTPLFAPFSPSPARVVSAVWDFLDTRMAPTPPLARDDLLVDLGCGDARWLVAGAQRYGCEALGVEIDGALVQRAREEVARCGLSDRIRVEQRDIWDADLSRARLVIVYAFAEALRGIRAHLETQLDTRAAVLSIGFRIPDWKPTWSDRVDGMRWYFYELSECRGE